MTATNGAGAAGAASANERTCACGSPLSAANKLGRCRKCCCRALSRDPAIAARRGAAAQSTFYADPAVRARHSAGCREGTARRMARPGEHERMSELGRRFGGRNLAAKQAPEAREKAAASIKRRHLAWCPEEFWPLNEQLSRKGFRLAERKDVILAEVPGTAQHARRQVLNHQTAQILRAEREKAQAY